MGCTIGLSIGPERPGLHSLRESRIASARRAPWLIGGSMALESMGCRDLLISSTHELFECH